MCVYRLKDLPCDACGAKSLRVKKNDEGGVLGANDELEPTRAGQDKTKAPTGLMVRVTCIGHITGSKFMTCTLQREDKCSWYHFPLLPKRIKSTLTQYFINYFHPPLPQN